MPEEVGQKQEGLMLRCDSQQIGQIPELLFSNLNMDLIHGVLKICLQSLQYSPFQRSSLLPLTGVWPGLSDLLLTSRMWHMMVCDL